MKTAYYASPIGRLVLRVKNDQLISLQLDESSKTVASDDHPVLRETCRQLDEYFAGKRQTFDLPLHTEGTTFQREVWEGLKQIPYATTISYAQLAQNVQHPKAYRAAGSANGKNPIAIIIPCHRVIASDGSLGGYAYGLAIKKQLLDLEQSVV